MNARETTVDSAPSPTRSQVNLKFLFAVLLLCWTALVGLSLWHNNSRLADHARDSARIQALTAFEKDVIYRRWNSIHGGVFVAVEDGKLAPNPYLAPKGREISDAGGKVYTKVNPAFMTRLVHEIGELHSGVRGHITSNNPIRPGNAPDPWESAALKLLEEGAATEVAEVLELDGRPYLRYISGLVTEQSCLSCHAFQGYKVGDIRGGISVAVPMTPFYAAMSESSQTLWLTHGALWLAGLCGISFGMNRLGRRVKERDQAESQLRKLAQELEERVARRTADLKAKQREMQAFVDNVDAGVFLKSTDGVYSFANARFASILNLPPAQIPGRLNAEILPPALARAVDAVEGEVIARGCGAEYRPQEEDGINTGYSFFIFPVLEEGQAVGLGGLVVDMTHRDQAEEALRRARDAAERANQAKSDFLANMSHEIRTPLNGVIGMADILLRTELTPEQSSMASAIKTSGDALLLVLNDILDLSKVESGRLALEKSPFSLRETLFSAARSVTHIAYGKGIELILDIADDVPDRLVGDSTRLRQIILNLANNALKFTEEGEVRIGVTLDWRHASSARLHFVVSDTGIGIPEEKQNGIFNAFEQADTSITRKYGGTGLGLAICVSFLQLMNSSIRLQSKVGKGSRFSFFLDLPLAEGATGLPPLPSLNGKEILIADKHPGAIELLARTLRAAGAKVDVAVNIAGVDAVAEKWHDAVIFGQRFTEDNYAELGRMRDSIPHAKDSPLYLMTEGLLAPDLQNIFKALFEKPVRPEQIVQSLWEDFNGKPAGESACGSGIRQTRPCEILLVEDVEINRMVATHMLGELGHSVFEATNGQEALDMLEKRSFDLVFMDIQMPIMDGVTATRKLREAERQNPARPRAAIVAMTANALKGDKDKYLEAGMDDYVSKPFQIDSLIEVIARNVGRE